MQDKEFEGALEYSLRLLNLRQRSEKELRDKLKKKNYSAVVTEGIIEHLKEIGLVDDAAFASVWVNTKMALRPSGIPRLKYELEEKGISPQIIELVLTELESKYDLKQTALELAKRKISHSGIKDNIKSKQRLYHYLKRRGFSVEVIFFVLGEMFGTAEATEE